MKTENTTMKDKMTPNQTNLLTKISLLFLLALIVFFGAIIYNQRNSLNLLGEKINNLIIEISAVNDKYGEIEEKIAAKPQRDQPDQYEMNSTDGQKFLDKKILINCLLQIKESIDISNKIPENCYAIFYLEDKEIKEKTNQLDLVTKESKSYEELGESFIAVSSSIEKELFKRKLLKWNLPKFFAEYLPNILTWRKIKEIDADTSESSLLRCEKYLKEKNLELVIKELNDFENLDIVKDWIRSALIYQKNSNILKEILAKILEKK